VAGLQFPRRELALGPGIGIVMTVNAPRAPRNEGAAANGSAFGRLLRGWRGRRGFSQLDLALATRTTQRHLSFIESGRATPTRAMILLLAATMSLPLRQQNALMTAAGYAPVWRERDLSTPDLAVVNSALDYMLAQHEPYPAFVVDRWWNVLRANRGAMSLSEFLIGPAPARSPSGPVNLAMALVSHDGLRPFIVNSQVVLYFVRGVQTDARADVRPRRRTCCRGCWPFTDVTALSETMPPEEEGQSPVLPIHFHHKGTSLRLFTTIATLGTPRDVTLQEVRIEFFFPMDEPTAQALRGWA